MKERQQSNVNYPLEFLMVQNTDHISPATGLVPTVMISKNAVPFAAPSGTVSEIGLGWYKISGGGLATDTNALGPLIIHSTAAGADPSDTIYTIVPWNPFDAVTLGLSSLPNVAQGNPGCLLTNGSGIGQLTLLNGVASASLSTSERDALATEILDLANAVENGETLRQTLRLLRSVLIGTSVETSGTVVFKRKDGTTTALTVAHDTLGSRTSSNVGSV